MTNTERDKAIWQALGHCWHESKLPAIDVDRSGKYPDGSHDLYECMKCGKYYQRRNLPDFSTDSGKVMLLREVMKLEDWFEFSKIIGFWSVGLRPLKTRHFFIKSELITDTTGKFALEVYDWFFRTGRIK